MIGQFLTWIVSKAFENVKLRQKLEPCIKQLFWRMVQENRNQHSDLLKKEYVQLARDEFILKHEIVKVKKGKRRYDLLFIEDGIGKGKRRIQISHHLESLHNNQMDVPI